MSFPDVLYVEKKSKELFSLFELQFTKQEYEAALKTVIRLCRLTFFQNLEINNMLVTTLLALDRPREILRYSRQFIADAIKKRNIDWILYFYQIIASLRTEEILEEMNATKHDLQYYLSSISSELRSAHNINPSCNSSRERVHVAHVIGMVGYGHAPTKLLIDELRFTDHNRIQNDIYCVEWAANWFYNRSSPEMYQSVDQDLIHEFKTDLQARVYVSNISHTFFERAVNLARTIQEHKTDIMVIHSSDAEAITFMLTLLKPAATIINVVHSFPICADTIDGYIHPHKDDIMNNVEVPQYYIPITTNIKSVRSDCIDKQSREAILHIEKLRTDKVISGTFGNLFKLHNDDYIQTIAKGLQENPDLMHIILGQGDSERLLSSFERLGVKDQILYFGYQKNIRPFIDVLDFYCASFPYPGCLSELECMALGKPVVSMAWTPHHHYNCGATIVGHDECIVHKDDYNGYVDVITGFVTDKEKRIRIGQELSTRFDTYYAPEVRSQKLEELYISITKGR